MEEHNGTDASILFVFCPKCHRQQQIAGGVCRFCGSPLELPETEETLPGDAGREEAFELPEKNGYARDPEMFRLPDGEKAELGWKTEPAYRQNLAGIDPIDFAALTANYSRRYSAEASIRYHAVYKCRKCGAVNVEQMKLTAETEKYEPGFDGTESRDEILDFARKMSLDAMQRVDLAYRKLAKDVNSGKAFERDRICAPSQGPLFPWEGACCECGYCQPWGTAAFKTGERRQRTAGYGIYFAFVAAVALMVFYFTKSAAVFFGALAAGLGGFAVLAAVRRADARKGSGTSDALQKEVLDMIGAGMEDRLPRISAGEQYASGDWRFKKLGQVSSDPGIDVNVFLEWDPDEE